MLRSCDVRAMALGVLLVIGCESSKAPPQFKENVFAPAPTQSKNSDPLAELRKVAEDGKKKVPTDGKKRLDDVSVDVRQTSSLVYPYVGRITSTWISKQESDDTDRACVYFKYENGKWKPTWASRAGSRRAFTEALTESDALTPGHSSLAYPSGSSWSNASYQFTAWVP